MGFYFSVLFTISLFAESTHSAATPQHTGNIQLAQNTTPQKTSNTPPVENTTPQQTEGTHPAQNTISQKTSNTPPVENTTPQQTDTPHLAEPTISEDIVFGQSAALTGPARHLGIQMREGILAAFRSVNQAGGVFGRKLKLISLDDAYEPEKTVKNTRDLIQKHQVFALIGGVGTPTSKAAVPIADSAHIPYIGPFTGAEFLRNTSQRYVVNIRASYKQEIQTMVDRLIQDLKTKRISILYQDDSYGRAGLSALESVLQKKGMKIASQGTYPRNTTAVKIALLEIMAGRPSAVVIVGAYLPTAHFIQLAQSLNFKPVFICLSFVGAKALAEELKNSSTPVVITQVTPFPFRAKTPLIKNYQKALKKDFNFVSLEGWLAGRFAAEVLKQAGENPSRENFLQTIQKIKTFPIDGFPLQYDTGDNQGSDQVFLTSIRKGKFFSIRSLKELFPSKKRTPKK